MASVFVSGFDFATDEAALQKHFRAAGPIQELYFQSNRGAVIIFKNAQAAGKAVDELDGSTMDGQRRYVAVKLDERSSEASGKGGAAGKGKSKGKSKRKSEGKGSGEGTSIYVSGFDSRVSDENTLQSHFGSVGKISHLHFQSKGSAVISYTTAAAASRAVAQLHETYMDGQERYVSVRADNPLGTRAAGTDSATRGGDTSGLAVYISGFDWDTDEEAVSKHFRTVGKIADLYFQSKGSAVVTYMNKDAAKRAVSELHETTMKGQSRYVAVKANEQREKGKASGKGKSKGKGKGKGKR
jgi:RNA recognition motif-containing protein